MTEREVFIREVPIEIGDGDGRTIDALLVPYGVRGTVADPPDFTPYEEEFVYGAFARQTKAPDRVKVWLNFEHEQGLRGIIGHGIALEERPDGLHGSFRVHPGPDGDKALAMIEEGILTAMSIEFAALKSKVANGVVQRLRAIVDKASLVMAGKEAYAGAGVLAVREAPDDDDDEPPPSEPVPEVARNEALDGVLSRIGYEPIMARAVVSTPWNGSASKYEDTDAYCAACIIDDNPAGEEKTQARCHLPVYEPNGDLNSNALKAAAGRLNQTQSPQKAAAARKLIRLYRQASMEPPESLRSLAAR